MTNLTLFNYRGFEMYYIEVTLYTLDLYLCIYLLQCDAYVIH